MTPSTVLQVIQTCSYTGSCTVSHRFPASETTNKRQVLPCLSSSIKFLFSRLHLAPQMPNALKRALSALNEDHDERRRWFVTKVDQPTGSKDASMSTTKSPAAATPSTLALFPSLSLHKKLVHLSVTSPRPRKRRISSVKQNTGLYTPPSASESEPPSVLVVCATPSPTKSAPPAAASPTRKTAVSSKMPPKPPPTRQLPAPPSAPSITPAIPGAPKFRLPRHVALHPEFNGTGDVLIVCTEQEQQIGFLVNGSMMRMAR